MSNIFVFTASNPEAKKHMRDTIESPIPKEKAERHFSGVELEKVREIGNKHGHYAWGAVPGPRNERTWKQMEPGDIILIYQDKTYTYCSKVLFTSRNNKFAIDNWDLDENGETWECMYFLEKPKKFTTPIDAKKLSNYLPGSYMGFMRITDDRVANIVRNYGDIDSFLRKEFLTEKVSELPNFWWVNQGKSYEIGRSEGYVWAPNQDRGGKLPIHWATMRNIKKGDIIFNYANGLIRAISVAKVESYDYDNKSAIDNWRSIGQRVDLTYYDIDNLQLETIKPHIEEMISNIVSMNVPFNKASGVRQGYLFNFSFEAARILRTIYGKPFPDPIEKYFNEKDAPILGSADNIINLLGSKKQIILYGPPGTGKTYNTKEIACNLLEGK